LEVASDEAFDRGFWYSDLGERYLQAQEGAVGRGVCIRRLFLLSRMDENHALFRRILDDPDFQDAVKDFYGSKVYREARKPLVDPGQDY
jgi:hypothetical protein